MDLELIVRIEFRRVHLDDRGRFPVPGVDAASIGVQHVFGVDQIAMIFQQPVDAVRLSAFFVGGEREDDVAVKGVPFLPEVEISVAIEGSRRRP